MLIRLISWAILAFLAACSPASYEDCVIDAAKSPTIRGVNTARDACAAKFKVKPVAAVAEPEKTGLAPAEFAETWGSWYDAIRADPDSEYFGQVSRWERRFGPPTMVINPSPCLMPGRERESCAFYVWKDDRPGRVELFFKLRTGPGDLRIVSGAFRESRSLTD